MIVPREVQTSAAVAEHYDELDPFYREIWGDHVHHGLWTTGRETPDQAVEALIRRLAGKLALEPGQKVAMWAAVMGRQPNGSPDIMEYTSQASLSRPRSYNRQKSAARDRPSSASSGRIGLRTRSRIVPSIM
jgi:hypothetical protein